MKVNIEKSFKKDFNKIRNKKILLELQKIINSFEKSLSINELPNVKKIESYSSYYRIRIGDYRLGLEKISPDEITLIRFLHRKEIYRYFPRK